MSNSHETTAKPSTILVGVCCAIVHRARPEWLAITVREAAAQSQCKPERISRLASRATAAFERVINGLMRMGRPPKRNRKRRGQATDKLHGALLNAASELLAVIPWGVARPAIRAGMVGAYIRMRAQFPQLTQKKFCAVMGGIPERTLRYWLKNAPANNKPPSKDPAPKPRRKRPLRRGRFGFDVTIPGTQLAADTTDITAFGVPLKLIATQDVGGRDQDLFESVIVDDHESANLVIEALSGAIDKRPGMQTITDQGTPYMAEATRAALDELDAEHAPQREGTPTAKATIERAFRSIKTIAGPLLEISNRVAVALPSLKSTSFAKAAVMILMTALLRAYQAGGRAAHRASAQRAGVSQAALALKQASNRSTFS